MLHVILQEPEIPPNTGNIIRLCANAGCQLHLVEPLGFTLDDRNLKRAGLDYHDLANTRVHKDLAECLTSLHDIRLFSFSTKHNVCYSDCDYPEDAALLFGSESRGLTVEQRQMASPDCRVTLPMVSGNRSLNLSNSVAIAVYEVWRQHSFKDWAKQTRI